MKNILGGAIMAAAILAVPSAASAGELTLSINSGRVTLIADQVPLPQILAEWARIGKTTIVNGEKLSGPPLTLQLVDKPEREVLDLLLRVASGYIVAPRAIAMAGASAFDRIMIMPTSRPPAVSASAMPPTFNARPQPQPQPMEPDTDDPVEHPTPAIPPGMMPNMPNGMPAMPNGMPPNGVMPNGMPQNAVPQAVPGMPNNPQGPQTAPRPGMLPAPQPGQPNPYGAPQLPVPLPPGVRPPGGGGGGEGDSSK